MCFKSFSIFNLTIFAGTFLHFDFIFRFLDIFRIHNHVLLIYFFDVIRNLEILVFWIIFILSLNSIFDFFCLVLSFNLVNVLRLVKNATIIYLLFSLLIILVLLIIFLILYFDNVARKPFFRFFYFFCAILGKFQNFFDCLDCYFRNVDLKRRVVLKIHNLEHSLSLHPNFLPSALKLSMEPGNSLSSPANTHNSEWCSAKISLSFKFFRSHWNIRLVWLLLEPRAT